jgi:hypothetical protein
VRLLSLARVLFTFLALQLAIGLQPGVATAAPAQKIEARGACPEHTAHGAVDTAQPAAKLTHHHAANDPSPGKHDCCKSSGCQNHCGDLPLAVTATPVRAAPDSSLVRPTPTARSASALPDTHFRPPIAS